MKTFATVILTSSLILTGCESFHLLDTRTDPDRPAYGKEAIAVPPPHVDIVNADPRAPGGGVIITQQVVGTWTFTTPPTVTRVERKTAVFDRFSLYTGIPAPTDVPFLVITVSRDRTSVAETEPDNYKVTGKREYVMNGNVAQEWTGQTKNGAGFCELIVRKPGTAGQTGDVCHATALARTEDEQKMALDILGSIVWTPLP
jgi:hypothetical protein